MTHSKNCNMSSFRAENGRAENINLMIKFIDGLKATIQFISGTSFFISGEFFQRDDPPDVSGSAG